MRDDLSDRPVDLYSKARLTVSEMARLVAEHMSCHPGVRAVEVSEDGDVSVDLVGGKTFEIQTVPVAHALNASMEKRKQALDDLSKRCA